MLINLICRLHVTYVDKEGDEHKFVVAAGDNLLDIAQSEELEMEGTLRDLKQVIASLIWASQEHAEDLAPVRLVTS